MPVDDNVVYLAVGAGKTNVTRAAPPASRRLMYRRSTEGKSRAMTSYIVDSVVDKY